MREAPDDSLESRNAWTKGPYKLRAFRRILFGSRDLGRVSGQAPGFKFRVGDYGFLASGAA